MLPMTYEAVCADVLTAFKEAEYIVADSQQDSETSPEPSFAHWALSLPAYMHFTSTIRRYADILVHRRLAYILSSNETSSSVATMRRHGHSHAEFLENLKRAVKTCNQ